MTVAVNVNAKPCQARLSSRDFSSAHRMVEPDLGASHKVPKTEVDKMGATTTDREVGDTHEYDSLQVRPLRAAAARWPLGLQQVDEPAVLLRGPLQRRQEEGAAMRYRVRNYTDLPIKEVRRLVKFAGGDLDFERCVVYVDVRWTQPHRDRTNPYPASGLADWSAGVNLRIAKPETYPAPWYDRSYVGLELGMINDWRESLVAIAAHELKHVAEIQRGCSARHRLMEGRCDAYAFSRLTAYRGASNVTA